MLAHFTDTLTTLITNLYISTGLLGIVLAMAIESCCIPLPSEIVMPVAGIMLVSGKILHGTNFIVSLVLVALAGAVGCLLGSIVAYAIGRSGGRSLMLKYGRYVLISQHDADKADEFFLKWGSATAFFSRLLPIVRTYISLPAGIAEMPFGKFCLYTFLGSFPWCLLLAYLGTLLGNNIARLSPIFHDLDIVIALAVVGLIALYLWRHIRNDKRARAATAERAQKETVADAMKQEAAQSWQQPAAQPSWSQQQYPQQPDWNQQSPPQSFQPSWSSPSPQFRPPQQLWNHESPTPPPQSTQGWGQQEQFPEQ